MIPGSWAARRGTRWPRRAGAGRSTTTDRGDAAGEARLGRAVDRRVADHVVDREIVDGRLHDRAGTLVRRHEAADVVILILAGFGSGFINAVAGGGSALSLPVLTELVDANTANGTNRVAILMGNLSSLYAYNKGGRCAGSRRGASSRRRCSVR